MPSQTTKHCYPLLKKYGLDYERVEHRNAYTGTSHDFKGFADILAWTPRRPGVLAIQACSESTFLAHREKLVSLTTPILSWLSARNRFEIWCWCDRVVKTQKRRVLRPITVYAHEPLDSSPLLIGLQETELTHYGYSCPLDADLSGSVDWKPLDARVRRPFKRS
jgi:hypothetical protein